MNAEQKRLAREIFADALEKADAQERAAWVAQACAADPELRQLVDALLQAHEQASGFLQQTTVVPKDSSEGPGTMIGRYKLLQEIGEGGFGRVFMAEQVEPVQRKVALKIIKAGMDTREVIARFEAERQALALMDHPNIARVLDGGATESGRPYFVMELVKGIRITDYCDQNHLPTEERLRLFIKVCHAVQHAHQKGVIHRDLKPSNVMITLHDGEAVPKVIDFGIAKATGQRLTDKTLFTRYEQMIGTPAYMSPEQAAMSGLDVDTRTDIYALGVLLYELLTGVTPFDKETLAKAAFDEIRRMIRETEPPKPSTRLKTQLVGTRSTASSTRDGDGVESVPTQSRNPQEVRQLIRLIQGDLDWIVMKALEKDRGRRYATANDFAEDVERNLKHEPVVASPPSAAYRTRKFVRRHRGMVAGTVAILLGLVVISVGSVLMGAYARKQAKVQRLLVMEKDEQRKAARQSLYFAHLRVAMQDWQSGQIARMQETLRQHIPQAGETDQRGWEWHYLLSLCHRDERTLYGHTGTVHAAAVHPDGRSFASGGSDRTVKIWDAKSGQVKAEFKGHEGGIECVAWSPDGSRLASGGWDGKLILWDPQTGRRVSVLDCPRYVWAVAWSPDGTRVAAGQTGDVPEPDGLVTVWDVSSGRRLHSLQGGVCIVWSLAWHPDGRRLVTGENYRGRIQVWDTDSGQVLTTFKAHGHLISSVAWSPDGRRLASSSVDQSIRIWDGDTWNQLLEIPAAHEGSVLSVAWSADGERLISGGLDGIVRVWNGQTGARSNELRGHQGGVHAVAWWQQHGKALSGGADGCLKIWDTNRQQTRREVDGLCAFAWSPDGSQFATDTHNPEGSEPPGFINIWDVASWRLLYRLPRSVTNEVDLLWSPDGRKLAVGTGGSRVQVWDLVRREVIFTDGETNEMEHIRSLDWSPDGRLLAAGCFDGVVRIWSPLTKDPIVLFRGHQSPVAAAAWNPDGRRIASVDFEGRVLVWVAHSGEILRECQAGAKLANGIAWHPRGDFVATGGGHGDIFIWNAATGHEVRRLRGHTSSVRSVDWSPDGRRLVSSAEDRTVRIWDIDMGQELLLLPCRAGWIAPVAWSPNGRMIGVYRKPVWVFDATPGYEMGGKLTPPTNPQ